MKSKNIKKTPHNSRKTILVRYHLKTWRIMCPKCAAQIEIDSNCCSVPNSDCTLIDDKFCPFCGRDMTSSLNNVADTVRKG